MHAGNSAAKLGLGVKIRAKQRFKALDADNYPRITSDLKTQIEGRLNRLIAAALLATYAIFFIPTMLLISEMEVYANISLSLIVAAMPTVMVAVELRGLSIDFALYRMLKAEIRGSQLQIPNLQLQISSPQPQVSDYLGSTPLDSHFSSSAILPTMQTTSKKEYQPCH